MIKYRKAKLNDKEQIAKLMVKLHKETSYNEILKEMDYLMKKYTYFVATSKNNIIGYSYGTIRHDYVEGSEQLTNPKVGYLESIYVLPKYRNNGVARELCQILENWSKERGATEFASDCNLKNKASYKFHTAVGFKETGKIVHFLKQI